MLRGDVEIAEGVIEVTWTVWWHMVEGGGMMVCDCEMKGLFVIGEGVAQGRSRLILLGDWVWLGEGRWEGDRGIKRGEG